MRSGARERLLGAARVVSPLLAVLALGAIFNADAAFFRWATHAALAREIAVPGVLACGMTLVIISGGIDLAVGSLLGLCAVSFALLSLRHSWSGFAAGIAVLVLGAAAGGASGAFVARARMPAFIVTLAMLVFARGLAKHLSGGQKVSTYVQAADGRFSALELPPIYSQIDSRVLAGQVPVVTLVFLSCAALTWLLLARHKLGRYLLAIGGNAEAARLSGVPVAPALVMAYALSGSFAAVAGICQAAQEAQGDPETGLGYELDAIAMVVIGGTRLSGGRGGAGRTVLGVFTLGYLQKVLSLNAFSSDLRLILTGVILLAALWIQHEYRAPGES